MMEQTYIMLKPDALQRRLMGEIITRIEKKGFNITEMQMMKLTEEILREHYAELVERDFFPDLVAFMTSGPVVGMIVEGDDVIAGMRRMMGPTNWKDAPSGTIRGDYAFNTTTNLIHGSDSKEHAEAEIKRFFKR